MNYQIILPSYALSNYVSYFWTLQYSGGLGEEIVFNSFVDNSTGIIFQHNQGKSAFYQKGKGELLTSFVYGPSTKPTVTFGADVFELNGVLFKPGGLRALLRMDTDELTDEMVCINEFAEGCELADHLLNIQSTEQRMEVLEQFLSRRMSNSLAFDQLIHHSLDLIHAQIDTIRMLDLCKTLKLSDKQFERRFKRSIGVTPIFYTRVCRFQNAMELIKTGQYNKLGDVAYALGYSDQSHFIKDIKQFSGYAPRDLSQQVSDFVVNLNKPLGLQSEAKS